MAKMSAEKRRTIYGMATQLGIYDKQNKDDDLHTLVYRVTNKESIGQLTDREAGTVISELVKLKGGKPKGAAGPSEKNPRPGMITKGMQKTVWFYMYRLEGLDARTSQLTRGERLCAIIKKYLHLDARPQDPMRFVTFQAGNTLIEIIKKMVQYEERKAGVKSNDK